MNRLTCCAATVALCLSVTMLSAAEKRGADSAYPAINDFMSALSLSPGAVHSMDDSAVEGLISVSASQGINVFELMDCVNRYAQGAGLRILIQGDSLRSLEGRFNLGDERVLSILPVDKVVKIEIGSRLSAGQKDVDIWLDSEYESYIEIGKARYETRFGFERLTPLLFDGCYGVQVSRFFITTPLEKLELYAPAKGAIYVKGLSKPKRWNLSIISAR